MSKWSKSQPDTSSPFHNFCVQNQRNKIEFFFVQILPQKTGWFLSRGFITQCCYLFSCFSLAFKCQRCRLVNLNAILNLDSSKIPDKYCFDFFVSASDICGGLYIGFVPCLPSFVSPKEFATGMATWGGKGRKRLKRKLT